MKRDELARLADDRRRRRPGDRRRRGVRRLRLRRAIPSRVETAAIEPALTARGPRLQPGRAVEVVRPAPSEARLDRRRRPATPTATMAGLELIADTYLSVAAPVQQALPELFTLGAGIRAAIAARVAANRTALAQAWNARRRARCCRRRPAGRRSCGCRPSAATKSGRPGWCPRRASWFTPDTSSTCVAGRSWSSASCRNRRFSPKPSDD